MQSIFNKVKGLIVLELGLQKQRFLGKTKKQLKAYYSYTNEKKGPLKKTLIYMVDGRVYGGGISDIIRGIISIYKLSKELGFEYKINFKEPYHLYDYLIPNKYNWVIDDNRISYNSNESVPLWYYCVHSKYGRKREEEIKYQNSLVKDFINNNPSKLQYHIYTNSEWSCGEEYSILFNELFKPSERLQNILNSHNDLLNYNYISVTLRFQQLLGDFEENNSVVVKSDYENLLDHISNKLKDNESIIDRDTYMRHTRALLGDFKDKKISVALNASDRQVLINNCIKKISEIHNTMFPDIKILVTSDSQIFLSEVRKLDFVYTIPTLTKKEDMSVNDNFQVFLKPFVDILMLSGAQKLYLLCEKSMYHSGFAKYASFIHNRDYQEIDF